MLNSENPSADFAALESTALVTFFLKTATDTHSVDLLGSWDNFTVPYPMTKDSRKGRGHWRGIHSFTNIICDGDPSLESAKRNGALTSGGLYWYYYRLNGHCEYHDPSQLSTTACPLLPGQRVNVLEVPFELSTPSLSHSQKLELLECMTLNPKDRWAPLKRKRAQKAATESAARPANLKRDAYLDDAWGRQFTAAGEAAILTSSGYVPPHGGTEDQDQTERRPATYHEMSTRTKSVNAVFANISSPLVSPALSFMSPETCKQSTLERWDSTYSSRPAETRRRLQSPISFSFSKQIKKQVLSQRAPPSRSRTAMASLSLDHPIAGDSINMFAERLRFTRPRSAPTAIVRTDPTSLVSEPSDPAKIEGRMKSLRLRVACAKLKRMHKELESSPQASTWDLNGPPKSFSNVLKDYHTSDEEQDYRRPRQDSVVISEMSPSLPQLSLSSRESTLWTADSGSLKTGSDLWDQSLRNSFRCSLQSDLTVYDDEDRDISKEEESDAGNRGAGLGIRFSIHGLESHETITQARFVQAPPKPLDTNWNPFKDPIGTENESLQRNEDAELHSDNAGSELMSDLAFLGSAIA